MLYSEFLAGTGCRDNDYNHKIYKQLELIYMNDESTTKADIYEYGKKLVDNSKPAELIQLEKEIKADIENSQNQITELKKDIARFKSYIETETDPAWRRLWKHDIDWRKSDIKRLKQHIAGCKFILN